MADATPLRHLINDLRREGRPSFAWVTEWGTGGGDPVAAAWAAETDPKALVRLLAWTAGPGAATRALVAAARLAAVRSRGDARDRIARALDAAAAWAEATAAGVDAALGSARRALDGAGRSMARRAAESTLNFATEFHWRVARDPEVALTHAYWAIDEAVQALSPRAPWSARPRIAAAIRAAVDAPTLADVLATMAARGAP